MKDPAFSLEGLSGLDQGIFEGVSGPLHAMEVVVSEGGLEQALRTTLGKVFQRSKMTQ
jgi:hypothetical protein